ncbi:hypothetical protein [Cetobacterium sp.]|uniref:hypothetical protein n=1 Tax=Cetobacterium sp. TaxID=2071632 RepID=UPI003F3035A5
MSSLNSFGITDTTFSDEFNKEISDSQFYAQPKNTELKIHFNDEKDSLIIGNAIVMNIEYTDEKIPVYSYNSSTYQKYLKGKSIITGVIALRKTTVDKIIALIKSKNISKDNTEKIESLKKELEAIKDLLKKTTDNSSFYTFYQNKQAQINKDIANLEDINNNQYVDNYERTSSNIKGDLLYYNSFTNNNNGVLTISYKDDFIEEVDKITNILFTRKQTEINVGRNDIIEIYHFIGNPSKDI